MKHKSVLKIAARRIFFQTLFFSTLLFAILAGFHWQALKPGVPVDPLFYGSMFLFLILFGLLQWMVQKNTLAKLLADRTVRPKANEAPPPGSRQVDDDQEARTNEQKRLFVHLFSVLQREGRLLDFFQEDLSLYEDAQIGAAVRGIHESCVKSLSRYLSPKPIMEQAEGDTVSIPPGFDPNAVKLTGNVVGQPPFTGILRHRGWRLQSVALPELSASDNPALLAPAEVEII